MSSPLLEATLEWRRAFMGATVAAQSVTQTTNPVSVDRLEQEKRHLERRLRERWAGKSRADLRADPVQAVYATYYRTFGQSYHVTMQIESIALKGRSIPSRAALVEAMFMAELETGLLTAVHDASLVRGQVRLFAATGEELFARPDGTEERCKPGDMAIRDEAGVLSSIIQGPTGHAQAGPNTTHALFFTYAPAGIEHAILERHLSLIRRYIDFVSPGAVWTIPSIITA